MSDGALPAAWYPDPDDAARLRWWDGRSWTEHVQQLPPPPAAALVPAEADPFVIKTSVPETGTWYAETGSHHLPGSTRAPAPVLPHHDQDAHEDVPTGPTWTVESWVLALLPLVAFGLQYVLWVIGDPNGQVFTANPVLFWIVPAALVVAGPLLAIIDRIALTARGVNDLPSPAIGILPPVYFLLRAVNVGASSVGPLIVWCALAVGLYTPWHYLIEWFFAMLGQVAAAS